MTFRTRFSISALVCILLAAAGFAQGLSVSYLEGSVEQLSGSNWTPVQIGDQVAGNASLRLARDAYVEISAPNGLVKLSKAGTYMLSDVVKGSASVQKANLASLVAGRVQKLTQKTAGDRASTVGGVRAEKANVEKLSWAGDENMQELLERGIKEMTAGNFARALDSFEEARAASDADSARRVDFYTGYTLYLKGDGRRAFKTLKAVSAKPADDFHGLYVITLAGLYLEANDPADALGLLDTYAGADKESAQSVLFLKGLALKQSGDNASARRTLISARDLEPASEAGKAASAALAEL